MSIPAIITAGTLTRVETDFLELVFLVDAGIRLCCYVNAGVYKWPFHLSNQDFCAALAKRCPENAEQVSIL